jgi:hypothetical protein
MAISNCLFLPSSPNSPDFEATPIINKQREIELATVRAAYSNGYEVGRLCTAST